MFKDANGSFLVLWLSFKGYLNWDYCSIINNHGRAFLIFILFDQDAKSLKNDESLV